MFKKNLSPKQLSALTSLLIAIPIAFGTFLLTNVLKSLIVFIIVFIGSYFLIAFVLDWFIYRKIKLIYKFIYHTKASKKEETYYNYILPKKGMDEVREDVEKWANQRSLEIEALQKNEAFRREFLQNFSHELKTPIFAIQGYVESLLDGGMHEPEILNRFLTNTNKNVERITSLLTDLDAITQLETGVQTLDKKIFVIQDLVKDVYETLAIKTLKKNITCIIKKGCEKPIYVCADKERIRQVLINLIQNATHYGKQGGNIIASMYNTDDKHALIEISDDGMGMEEEHIPRIFERFYRTNQARTINTKGSGLGLAICKHIIEAHHQTIHARGKIGVGSTIGFTLELKK